MARFPIRFDPAYAVLSSALLLRPSASFVELAPEEIRVQMAWGFRTHFPRRDMRSAAMVDSHPISRGVHGWAGRWLVNGAGRGIVRLELDPPARAWVTGFPVQLRELLVSLEDPDGFLRVLSSAG